MTDDPQLLFVEGSNAVAAKHHGFDFDAGAFFEKNRFDTAFFASLGLLGAGIFSTANLALVSPDNVSNLFQGLLMASSMIQKKGWITSPNTCWLL